MGLTASASNNSAGASRAKAEALDLNALPHSLAAQCRSLIESYHEIHGYNCLPNMLWRAELGDFIKRQPCLRQILRKASTTRSAKLANKGFVEIATAILSLEILASDFASWSTMFPEAKSMANALLRMRSARMFLMEHYLYPPKHISPAVLAALTPPQPALQPAEPGWHAASSPELASQKRALNYANAMRDEAKGEQGFALPVSSWA
ncbi:MAG TPA: hypothetical protein VHY56_03305 [Candidatus Binataceae bacterium]|nr:hypothetical protein [Candidatus Binataceae bacterium]